jgi:hypothetical protein
LTWNDVHELARGEDRGHELGPVDHRVQAPLQELDQPLAGIALAAHGLGVVAAELALADVAVVALELLFGRQLGAEIRRLAAALAVLAGRVVALVDGAFRTAPEIDPQAPVDLVFRCSTLRHGAAAPFFFRRFVPVVPALARPGGVRTFAAPHSRE